MTDPSWTVKALDLSGEANLVAIIPPKDDNKCLTQKNILILKAPIMTAADDIRKYFFLVFQRK